MSRRSVATLQGMIRLTPNTNCIGIAVFRESGMNYDLVAETDGELRITRFLEMYPEQGYSIEPLSANMVVKRRHSINDPVPIPFLVDGAMRMVMGDRQPSDVDCIGKVTASRAVVDDVRKLLADARSGVFIEREKRWKVAELHRVFPDVFDDRPVGSRYWVTRYRSAISRSRQLNLFSDATGAEFRARGSRWLELFATKTDFGRMKLLFGEADDGVFNREDVVSSAFGFFCHKLAGGDFKLLEKAAATDGIFLGLFPEGLYYHQSFHGYPRTPFAYSRPRDFLEEFKTRLYRASEGNFKFARLRHLSIALFGTKDAPVEFMQQITPLRLELTSKLRHWKEELDDIFGDDPLRDLSLKGHSKRTRDLAHRVLNTYDALADLEGVEYGNARLAPRANDYLAQQAGFMERLRNDLKGGYFSDEEGWEDQDP